MYAAAGRDYSLLAPFLEVVCPTAPSIEELEGCAAWGNQSSASASSASSASSGGHSHSHNHYPVPRFCHRHNLKCHIADHRASLAKSTLDFDAILYGDHPTGGAASSTASARREGFAVDSAIDALLGLSNSSSATSGGGTAAKKTPQQRPKTNTEPLLVSRPEAHETPSAPADGAESSQQQKQRIPRFDVAVVVSFRYFISDDLLRRLPPVINVHPSLLPKYRGCSPIFSTMLRGDSAGGASIIKIGPREAMDSGDVLLQRRLAIAPDEDMRSYFPRLMGLAGQMLGEVLLPHLPVFVAGGGGVGAGLPLPPSATSLAVVAADGSSSSSPSSVPTAVPASGFICSAAAPSSGSSSPFLRRPMPWRAHFSKLWANAAKQTNKIHFKSDPFYAPMIPRHRATYLRFDFISGAEAYDMWRTFVGGQFFGAVAASLDRRATPVADELLRRAVSKYRKRNMRQQQKQQAHPPAASANPQKGSKRSSGGGGGSEMLTAVSTASTVAAAASTAPADVAQQQQQHPPLPADVIDELMRTHVTFLEAKCPLHVCSKTHELLARLSSGALLPGAACFPSTDESVVAIMCGRRSVDPLKAEAEAVGGSGAPTRDISSVLSNDEDAVAAGGASTTESHLRSSYYPTVVGDAEWFFVKELMLQGSKGSTRPAVLRTSLAMKKDTVYPFLFTSDKAPWTIALQQAKSQGRAPPS